MSDTSEEHLKRFEDVAKSLDNAVTVFAASVAMFVTVSGMNALNQHRIHRGEAIAYTDNAYEALLTEYEKAILKMGEPRP